MNRVQCTDLNCIVTKLEITISITIIPGFRDHTFLKDQEHVLLQELGNFLHKIGTQDGEGYISSWAEGEVCEEGGGECSSFLILFFSIP